MTTVFEEVKPLALKNLYKWVDNLKDPDQSIIGIGGTNEALTPRLILKHVEEETPIGRQFVMTWHKLAMRHIAQAWERQEQSRTLSDIQ
jgi:hypothetical protein